jgi:DNA-binding HxlR family transcriptional regulator
MQRTKLGHIACSLARAVDVVGEWWTPLILRDLFVGITRFEDLRRDLGLASNVLADRLATLTEEGIVERRPYQEAPTRWEYVLTEKGRDLFPVIVALLRWGDRWKASAAGPPAVLVHDACGRSTSAKLVCSHCGGELTSDAVTAVAGPGGRRGSGTSLIGPILAERARAVAAREPNAHSKRATRATRRTRPAS